MEHDDEEGDFIGDPIRIEAVIGANIKRRREFRGLSQAEFGKLLATYLGGPWPPQTVSTAEKGRRQFVAAEVAAIARLLSCRPQDLFTPKTPSRVQISDAYILEPDFSAPLENSLDRAPLDISFWLQPFSDAYRELLRAKDQAVEVQKLSSELSSQIGLTEQILTRFVPADEADEDDGWDAIEAMENMENDDA